MIPKPNIARAVVVAPIPTDEAYAAAATELRVAALSAAPAAAACAACELASPVANWSPPSIAAPADPMTSKSTPTPAIEWPDPPSIELFTPANPATIDK